MEFCVLLTHPDSYVEALTSSVMIEGGGALGR